MLDAYDLMLLVGDVARNARLHKLVLLFDHTLNTLFLLYYDRIFFRDLDGQCLDFLGCLLFQGNFLVSH